MTFFTILTAALAAAPLLFLAAVLLLRRKGSGDLRLGGRIFLWDLERFAALSRIDSLMNMCRDSGGESSPYFEDLQDAFRDLTELEKRHPAAAAP